MREEAFLNAGLRITIEDKRLESEEKPESERRDSMCYEGGIREFVTWLNKKKEPLHNNVIYMSGMKGDSFAELALQYDDAIRKISCRSPTTSTRPRAACTRPDSRPRSRA